VSDQDHRSSIQLAEPPHDRGVIPEASIAVKLDKILKHRAEVMGSLGTVNMPGELCDLPRRQVGENLLLQTLELLLQGLELFAKMNLFVSRKPFEVFDLIF
jgi:hypothetical protein